MKLLKTLLLSSSAAGWEQPTYQEVLDIIKQKSEDSWGHPIDRIAALWSLCPALEVPTGGQELVCDQSTCAVVCNPGFIATGKRRTRCRWKKAQGFFWKKALGICETCTTLTAPAGVTQTCAIDARNKMKCSHSCASEGHVFSLDNGKTPKEINLKCKCPRDRVTGVRSCGWYATKMGGLVTDISTLSCSEPVTAVPTTAAPTTVAPATTFAALTDLIDRTLTHCSAADNGFSRANKIVNGVEAELNSWPSIVNLFFYTGDSGGQCGGTVIDNNWVLTAAHCCAYPDGSFDSNVLATFGEGRQDVEDAGQFQIDVTSDNMFVHPDYWVDTDGSNANMDLCLVKFDTDLIGQSTDGNVALACLPKAVPVGGEGCWVAGWGQQFSGAGVVNNELHSIGVNIFSQDYCINNTIETVLMPDDICAGIPDSDGMNGADGGKDSCQNDSGGPLMCPVDGKATLMGVVSRGPGCAEPNTAGLYSGTFQGLSWIQETIANNGVPETTATPTTTPTPTEFAPLSDLIDSTLTHCSAADNGFSRANKIVNGVEATLNSWPSIVKLDFYTVDSVGQCGGTVIDNNWVLTAAHCCDTPGVQAYFGEGRQDVEDPGQFMIDLTLTTDSNVFLHPLYNDMTDGVQGNMDYCLLKFDSDLIAQGTNNNVAIACLPAAAPVGGEGCWVAGWGQTEEGGGVVNNELHSIGVNIFSQEYCALNAVTGNDALMPDDVCAGIPDADGMNGAEGGKDSCQNDSGGPLVCPVGGKATLMGVVSRGPGCAREGTAGLYSGTFHALEWIRETIANNP